MTNVPFTVECRVGRLVESRGMELRDADDVARLEAAMRGLFVKIGRKCVICADLRAVNLFSPKVSDLVIAMLQRGNVYVERSATLLASKGGGFHLQMERVVRAAKSERRRTFRIPRALEAWLGEVLDEAERERVRAFLSLTE